jgi:serine protease Do
MSHIRLIASALLITVSAAACGSATASGGPIDAPSRATTETTAPLTETTVTTEFRPGRPARSLEEVQQAVVQVVASGTFEEPEGELINVAGAGTGFVIDGTGLAVTNNHVVTGAAYLDVYVDGEGQPRRGRVVAVSECSDLAVIDIDGDFDVYLEWFDAPIEVGQEIFVGGFPLGDPTYTLYDGIVAKTIETSDTPWASVSLEIEHTADTKPGNSGSPIVTDDGHVLGVHYAGGAEDQGYGIALPFARDVVDQLLSGHDVDAIGINGEAFVTEDDFTGIWVSSVESGSPAAEAGIQPGDIVTRIENLVVAADGTMGEYCKVLRTHEADDPMSIEIIRLETGEILNGVLNGDELEVSGTIDNGETEPEPGDTTPNEGGNVVTIEDETGTLSMDVPAAWSDVVSGTWEMDGVTVGLSLSAAPDLEAWANTWGTPGASFMASADLAGQYSPAEFLASLSGWSDCAESSSDQYDDGVYSGRYELWTGCGDTNATYLRLAAKPADGSHLAFVEIIWLSEQGYDHAVGVLNSFMVG